MKFKKNTLVVISCLTILFACNNNTQQTNLDVPEFEKAIANNNVQLVDVRTPQEYQSGHLKNALQADWNNENEFKDRVQTLDKNLPVYTYCLSGGRSTSATEYLNKNGFKAFNLSGGISAWKMANKPVEASVATKQLSLPEYLNNITKDKTVLVDFSAVWCPPCKKMEPILDSLQTVDAAKFILVKINGGEQSEICKQLKINAFPTFIVYKQGKEVWRKDGIVDAKELVAAF